MIKMFCVYKTNNIKVKVSVLEICLENCKRWKQIPKVTFPSSSFLKNIREVQTDYLCFLNYKRQMYHLNVLCLQDKHFQSKSECFTNLFGDL